MSQPKQDALSVIAGADLDETFYIWDDTTNDWVDWSDDVWQVRMEIRDRRGELLARLANYGTRDGEITLLSEGRLTIFLAGSVTAGLPITRPYTNSTDPRIAAFRHRGVLFFDLIATATTAGDAYGEGGFGGGVYGGGIDVSDLVQGSLTVHQPVSA